LKKGDAMSVTMKDLGIDRWSVEQRIELAIEIWQSLEEIQPISELSPEQRNERSRRDAELEANPNIALTWDQIRSSVEWKS
jgi:putative addiction module component (TIGR02574 family)